MRRSLQTQESEKVSKFGSLEAECNEKDAMIAAQTSAGSRGRMMARFELVTGAAAAVGPLVGGWLYDHVDVRAPFLANSALLLATAVGVVLLLRAPHEP